MDVSSPHISWPEVHSTMMASIRSVGTACTLAAVGVYLHRRGFVVGEGKRTLALISQQVTIPLFLFTRLVYCNQDWSDEPCPRITDSLEKGWFLLLWPAYVVAWGLVVGYLASIVSRTPKSQLKAVLAACAFGNSTGLPITLLTVVHANFPATTELGSVDPTLFLSIYLLSYPILQWGVGGWLLAPNDQDTAIEPLNIATPIQKAINQANIPMHRNVLNNLQTELWYSDTRRGIGEADASMYISTPDLVGLKSDSSQIIEALPMTFKIPPPPVDIYWHSGKEADPETNTLLGEQEIKLAAADQYSNTVVWDILKKILSRCLQPPVVGAILGLIVAATPVRGLFVDLVKRQNGAPLGWFFGALYAVGQAAIPLNMMILGCNLSKSMMGSRSGMLKPTVFSKKTVMAIVVGKLFIMPIIGVASVTVLQPIQKIPESINASMYLVAMIVFITPTANNVMIMVELSGSGMNESIANCIAWQYAVAPLILSFSMALVVGVASQWS